MINEHSCKYPYYFKFYMNHILNDDKITTVFIFDEKYSSCNKNKSNSSFIFVSNSAYTKWCKRTLCAGKNKI